MGSLTDLGPLFPPIGLSHQPQYENLCLVLLYLVLMSSLGDLLFSEKENGTVGGEGAVIEER